MLSFCLQVLLARKRVFFMARKKHDTFLMHLNHERMFTSVSPEQCQRLIEACFLLARTGEKMDMSDDMILDIFWEQISSFISGNEKYYTDVCDKKSQRQKERWAELKRLRAEKAMRDGTTPPDDDMGDDDDLPFGDNM